MERYETLHYWLTQRDFPKQYDLTVAPDGSRVGFRVHPAVWDSIIKRFKDPSQMTRYICLTSEERGLSPFSPRDGSGRPWGFGDAIVEDMSGNWPVIEATIRPSDLSNLDTGACLFLIQSAISIYEKDVEETIEEGKQSVTVDGFRVGNCLHGASLWLSVSPWFRRCVQTYLKKFNEDEVSIGLWQEGRFALPAELLRTLKVMRDTYRRISPIRPPQPRWEGDEVDPNVDQSYLDHDFHLHLRKSGGFHLEVPGDACGLDPDHDFWSAREAEGFKLVPHNTDAPSQQLGLFAGVAQLVKELSSRV